MYSRLARLTAIYGSPAIGLTMITMATIGYPAYGFIRPTPVIIGPRVIGAIQAVYMVFTEVTGGRM
jgi:hypothetical protein